MKRKPPPQREWKRIIKEKVNSKQVKKWMKSLNEKKSMKNLFGGDLKMNGKVNDMISYCKTPREVMAARIAVKMLIGELPTAEYQKRIGKDKENTCIYCENNYNLKYTDNNEHIITECKMLEDDKTLKEKILFTSTNHTDPVNNFAEKGQHKRHEKQAAKEILGYAI